MELKRISRTIGAFPNDASMLRFAGTILIDINEEWITSRRYFSGSVMMVCQDTQAEFYSSLDTLPAYLWFSEKGMQIKIANV